MFVIFLREFYFRFYLSYDLLDKNMYSLSSKLALTNMEQNGKIFHSFTGLNLIYLSGCLVSNLLPVNELKEGF